MSGSGSPELYARDVKQFRQLVESSGVHEYLSAVLLDLCELLPAAGQWDTVPALDVVCENIAARQAHRLRAEIAAARSYITTAEQDCWHRQAALSARQALTWIQLNHGPDHHGWSLVLADDLVLSVARLIRRTSRYELCRECAGLRDCGCPLLPRHWPIADFWQPGQVDTSGCRHRFRGNAARARRLCQSQAVLANWHSSLPDAHDGD